MSKWRETISFCPSSQRQKRAPAPAFGIPPQEAEDLVGVERHRRQWEAIALPVGRLSVVVAEEDAVMHGDFQFVFSAEQIQVDPGRVAPFERKRLEAP